ncbi:MAG TPA: lipocalin-like domain-containing protein [Planctomycetota bacterium]|nr:lipocalin-like domain-containing protein [Planctomycetota bacterium]
MSLGDVLGGRGADATGFARASEPPVLHFPADHGAHPAFRTEWWYVTGNLDSANGRRFGVQLVFFRQALAAAVPARAASLAARDVVLAHAAVTDVDGRVFHADERLARLAAGLAELQGPAFGLRFRIACNEWSAAAAPGGDGFLPLDLRAGGRGFSFALRVAPGKPLVLQGEAGLSRKSDEPGNASCYYSMTRLPIDGTIRVGGAEHAVHGLGWLDREWSTSALGPEQVGWDWFSLQLDSGEEVMWYRLRRRDGSIDAHSRGSFVDAAGAVAVLAPDAVTATPAGTWQAADGGARYPARWRLVCAEPAFDLEVTPLLPDQELRVLVRYWEGAVAVRGTRGAVPVAGRGYLEMTGYGRAK